MTWQSQLKADPLPWLLEADDPGVRYLALRDLADDPEPAELRAARQQAHTDGPIAAVLKRLNKAGYWAAPGPGYNPKYRATVWSIILLAQLGASAEENARIAHAWGFYDHSAFTRVFRAVTGVTPTQFRTG